MKAFTIEPFVGPLPLRFGMSPKAVDEILGPFEKSYDDDEGNRVELRTNVNVGYLAEEDTLREVVFTPNANLIFRGVELFRIADPISLLRKSDPSPKLFVGHVFFPSLGISVTGFHDNDDSQKAIAAYIRGYWDEFLEDFVPFE